MTAPASSSRDGSNSALAGRMAPTALRCAPCARCSSRRKGSTARVTVVTIGASFVASATDEHATASRESSERICSASCSPFAAVRFQSRTRRNGRTAATASTWRSAWRPAPIRASSSAPGRASQRVATPETAAVRSAPAAAASATPSDDPSEAAKSVITALAPAGVFTQVLKITRESSRSTAPSPCALALIGSAGQVAIVLSRFQAVPPDWCTSTCSSESITCGSVSAERTSASVQSLIRAPPRSRAAHSTPRQPHRSRRAAARRLRTPRPRARRPAAGIGVDLAARRPRWASRWR